MANRRQRSTPPSAPAAPSSPPPAPDYRKLATPDFRQLAWPPEQASPEQVERFRQMLARERAISNVAPRSQTPDPVAAETAKLGRKAQRAADAVLALWRGGYRWPDRETLRRKVHEHSGDKGLSLRTLTTALGYLRSRRLIDD